MKAKKVLKICLIAILSVFIAALLLVAAMFIRQAFIDSSINDDYTTLVQDPAYRTPVSVDGVEVISQEISCGYATIEMLAVWQDCDTTEASLLEQNNGGISTAMGTGFLDEMTRQFPQWHTERHVDLTNSELLKKTYESLASGMPVPIEFAAYLITVDREEWTLHFGLVTAMDFEEDRVTIQNPYGYQEVYSVQEFLDATRYDSYEDMELFYRFGFAFGMFHKNTIYTMENN